MWRPELHHVKPLRPTCPLCCKRVLCIIDGLTHTSHTCMDNTSPTWKTIKLRWIMVNPCESIFSISLLMGHPTTPKHLQECIAKQHSPPVLPSCKTSDAKSEDADADSTHLRSHTKRNWMTNDHQMKTWRSQQLFSQGWRHDIHWQKNKHWRCFFFFGGVIFAKFAGEWCMSDRIDAVLALAPSKKTFPAVRKGWWLFGVTLPALSQPKRPFATAGPIWALHIGVFSPFSLACLSSSLRWKVFFFTQSSPKSSRYQLSMPVSKSICTCPILTSHSTCVHWLLSSP